ncbi:FOG: RRM domain [Ceraceosorus bombacis]|uniref:FOG: RRM domain n=1 Tax=Ceraceosorus bombacis TaxID=401625 RepID=A0A0N7LBA7_9BASI|nr:FOG: RRM domain [Ceraceosorus bombacis]
MSGAEVSANRVGVGTPVSGTGTPGPSSNRPQPNSMGPPPPPHAFGSFPPPSFASRSGTPGGFPAPSQHSGSTGTPVDHQWARNQDQRSPPNLQQHQHNQEARFLTSPPPDAQRHAGLYAHNLTAPRPLQPYPRLQSPNSLEHDSARSPSPSKGAPRPGFGFGDASDRWSGISAVQGAQAPPAQQQGGHTGSAFGDPQSYRHSHSSGLPPHGQQPHPSQQGPAQRPGGPQRQSSNLGPSEPMAGAQDIWARGSGFRQPNDNERFIGGGGPASRPYQPQPSPSLAHAPSHFVPPNAETAPHGPPTRAFTLPPGVPELDQLNTRFDPHQGFGGRYGGEPSFGPSGARAEEGPFSAGPHGPQMRAGEDRRMQTPSTLGSLPSAGNLKITTVFIVGFPDDMTEREFANIFTFAKGFEASTLKIPSSGQNAAGTGGLPGRPGEVGASNLTGPGGPYNPVNLQGAGLYDLVGPGPPGGWDDHNLSLALSRVGAGDGMSSLSNMGSLSNALQGIANAGQGGQNGGSAAKIKQIIGFAKFRTRAEALEARDALNGRKIDAERGCVLKTEMAKKNLHTKQRPVLANTGGLADGQAGFGPSGIHALQGPQPNYEGNRTSPDKDGSGYSRPSVHGSFTNIGSGPQGQAGGYGVPGQQGTDGPVGGFLGSGAPFTHAPNGIVSPFSDGFRSDFFSPAAAGRGPTSMGPQQGQQALSLGPQTPSLMHQQHAAGGQQHLSSGQPSGDGLGLSKASTRDRWGPQQQQQQAGSRGPDWSALASPPSRFGLARPVASSGEGSGDAGPQSFAQGFASRMATGREDFGMGESTAQRSQRTLPPQAGSETARTQDNSESLSGHLMQQPDGQDGRGSVQQIASQMSDPRIGSPQQHPSTERQMPYQSSQHVANDHRAAQAPPAATGFSRPRSRHDSVGARSASIGNLSSPTSPLSSPSSRSFSIDTNPPGNTLFVGNLPQSSSAGALAAQLEERLRSAFSVKPGYRQLSFRVKVGGPMCFVEFDSVQSAGQSLAELNGDTLGGAVRNGGLRLSFSKNPLFRSTLPGAAGISSASIGSSGERSPASPPLGHGQLSLAQASATLLSSNPVSQLDLDTLDDVEESSYHSHTPPHKAAQSGLIAKAQDEGEDVDAQLDILDHLERIRARYKSLCSVLGVRRRIRAADAKHEKASDGNDILSGARMAFVKGRAVNPDHLAF